MLYLCCWLCRVFVHEKTNKCTNCYNFLTPDKQIELLNDVGSQYMLVDLLDRGSLIFPSLTVIDCVNIIY